MNKAPAAKRYAVFYTNSTGRRNEWLDREDAKTPLISIQDFHTGYEYLGTFEAKDLDDLFTNLQDGRGGLGHREGESSAEALVAAVMQDLVVRKVGHTSMYVGDIAVDLSTGEAKACAVVGWRKVAIVGAAMSLAGAKL